MVRTFGSAISLYFKVIYLDDECHPLFNCPALKRESISKSLGTGEGREQDLIAMGQ